MLEAVFAGEVIAVDADGPQGGGTWLARADAPAADIGRRYDRELRRADVPVFTAMTFRAWPGDQITSRGLHSFNLRANLTSRSDGGPR